jgi:4-aminobutyrate aminotransferase
MDAPGPGGLGGTYGGSPIGIAAGHAVLDVIEEERLCERAEMLGARLKQRLESLRGDVPEIADIRGPGFMKAIEFNLPGKHQPNPDFTTAVRLKALEKGLILLTCGVYSNVIRFLAPITIQDEVFTEALDIIEASIRECSKAAATKAAA